MLYFDKLAVRFPGQHIQVDERLRDSSVIRNHGAKVIKLIDEMITNFDNLPKLRKSLKFAVWNHLGPNASTMSSSNFMVCHAARRSNSFYEFHFIHNLGLHPQGSEDSEKWRSKT